jgi:hypothetical protein
MLPAGYGCNSREHTDCDTISYRGSSAKDALP